MRRKLKTDSTMKTITYGLFIYVSLTTFNGIPSAVGLEPKGPTPEQTKPKCDLQSIIKKSKYTGDCANTKTNAFLPDLSSSTTAQYLCTGIFETVNKICESNSTSINETYFERKTEESRGLVGKNLTKFCPLLKDSISKASKTPNIIKFNQTFIPQCDRFCYGGLPNLVDHLCVVLYSANEIAVNPYNHGSISSPQNAKSEKVIIDSSKPQAEQFDGKKAHASIPKKNPTTPSPEGSKKGKPETGMSNGINKQATPSRTSSPDQSIPMDPVQNVVEQADKAKEEEPATKAIKTGDEDTGTAGLAAGTGDEEPVKPPKSGAADTPLGMIEQQSDTGTEGDEETLPENPPKDEVNSHGDDIDTESTHSENSDPTRTNGKIVPDSDHGEEDKSSGKKDADTRQDSVGPQDHTLVHSGGPPDPPQHFFAYFMAVSFICIICYIGYHKKHKIMGIIFEGRKSRGGRGRRRPNTAGYRKLDCNLEEAVTSQCNSNVTHVIY